MTNRAESKRMRGMERSIRPPPADIPTVKGLIDLHGALLYLLTVAPVATQRESLARRQHGKNMPTRNAEDGGFPMPSGARAKFILRRPESLWCSVYPKTISSALRLNFNKNN